jgi:hypothetical protein
VTGASRGIGRCIALGLGEAGWTVYVTSRGYSPASFIISSGKPTWFYAIAQRAVSGCASFLLAPDYNLSTPIRIGANWLGPIQNPQRDFEITCSVGALRARVHVM